MPEMQSRQAALCAIDAACQFAYIPQQDNEATLEDMAEYWGVSVNEASIRLSLAVMEGTVYVRAPLIEGKSITLYGVSNG